MTGKKKLDLVRSLEAGRQAGADLARRRNPTEMTGPTVPSEIEHQLAEAERKSGGPLWEREWSATTLRSVRRSLGPEALEALTPRLEALKAKLQAADEEELGELKARLRSGELRPDAFREELQGRPSYEWDALTQRLFAVDDVPDRETERLPGMVHYLPSPMEAILQIVDLLRPDDVFYDIGSGLGLVTMLVAWLSEARVKGVELEPAYHRHAVRLAERFGFEVTYLLGDAREVDYSDGTVFYLYDTFRGRILQEMIGVLQGQAADRPIRVISRGESTPVFEQVDWLEKTGDRPSKLTLFMSSPSSS